jgi:hypothetical protein
MPGVTDTTITPMLDEVFAKVPMEKLFPNYSEIWKKKLKPAASHNINARGGFYLIQTGSSNSLETSDFTEAAGGDFPLAGESSYLKLNVSMKTDRSTIEWNGNVDAQNEAQQKQNPAKAVDYVGNELEGIMRFYAITRSRQIWQDGSNEVARISGVNTGTRTLTCNNAGNLFGVQLLEEGMLVEFRDASGNLRYDGMSRFVKIESTDRANKTFRYSAETPLPNGVTNADRVYPKGSYNNGWAGIDFFLGTSGTFEGMSDRTSHYRTTGVRIPAGGKSVSAGLLRRMLSSQKYRRDGEESDGEFYASAQYDAYEATGFATQSFGQSGDTLKRGFRKMFFDSKPFNEDIYVPRDVLAFVDFKKIHKFELLKFGPRKFRGDYVMPVPSANGQTWSDKFQILLQGFGNLGTNHPAAVGVWCSGLSTSGLALGND